ncbi:lactadherin-like [Asterias amurensis]|uniref:lactadherin-like n=1 Tax=Asterias amurensis TaxID=7602 RepID=UPI003AB76283
MIEPKRSYEPYYTDQPLFTDDVEEIHDYFECHDESVVTKKTIEHADCQAWFDAGSATSGVYPISIQSHTGMKEKKDVYCHMEDDKGWLVFQRRHDGSVNFTRTWLKYKEGFGDVGSEFWLGNEALRLLTKDGSNWTIRVDLTDEEGQKMSLMTSPFSITGDKYALSIGISVIEPTVNGTCHQRLGMEDNTIPDSSITSSSVYQRELVYCSGGNGRLNSVDGNWCPETDNAEWFQVDLKTQTQVEGVIMQGSYTSGDGEWVKKYTVEYSSHQSQWHYVGGTSQDTAKEFDGNTDHETPVTSMLDEPIQARYIRIRPTTYEKWPTMRIELIGCKGGVFESLNGRTFSTYDNDNDNDGQNCAGLVKAGWWFDDCAVESNLNGEYSHQANASGIEYRGIRWFTWQGRQIVKTEMKMRRNK